MGRRKEFENSKKKLTRYSEYETAAKTPDVRVLTYDAVASEFEYHRLTLRHTMKRKGNKFAFVKYNPQRSGEHLWTYLTKDHLKLTQSQIDAARDNGVRIDKWLKGKALANFGRDVAGKTKSLKNLTSTSP
jgi:hypothetical protein